MMRGSLCTLLKPTWHTVIALQGNSFDWCQLETGLGSKFVGTIVCLLDTTTGYLSGFLRSGVGTVSDNEFLVGVRALLWFVFSGNSAHDRGNIVRLVEAIALPSLLSACNK